MLLLTKTWGNAIGQKLCLLTRTEVKVLYSCINVKYDWYEWGRM